MSTVQERVQAGMAWLDERFPDHVERFNPDNFDIMCRSQDNDGWDHDRRCVLLQATGTFYWMDVCYLVGLDPLETEVVDLGFYPTWRTIQLHEDTELDQLNQAWLDAYAARKNA